MSPRQKTGGLVDAPRTGVCRCRAKIGEAHSTGARHQIMRVRAETLTEVVRGALYQEVRVIDPNPHESSMRTGRRQCRERVSAYVESLGKTDLARFTAGEWRRR